MNETSSGHHPLGWRMRGLLLVAAAGFAGLLGLAKTLVPDPRGFGTHVQLGLRPCSFATMTGRLCPTCGMTTAFAWFVRGRVDRSWRANPAGVPCWPCSRSLSWPGSSRAQSGASPSVSSHFRGP